MYPRGKNITVDKESRAVRDRCNWMIHPSVFAHLQPMMGPLEVDMFASRLTDQLPDFISWRLDPLTEATGCICTRLEGISGICQPTFVPAADHFGKDKGARSTGFANSSSL